MLGRLLGGRYQIQALLGRGGMGAVWRGVDLRLHRPVAVKVLDAARLTDPAAAQRFDREARTLARLAHPNIVAIYDVGHDGDEAYLVMELVDGESLAARLAGGPLAIEHAVAIATQVCQALTAAHNTAVVHRDIKPANILITAAGTVKVCDFGIARLLNPTASQPSLTAPATAVGTSDYMAPEQAAGDPVDARTDLYALGCVLYVMLTGGPPFTGDSPISVISQHLHRPAPPLRSRRADVPADLDALVAHLLAKNPADRPADADHVRARLTALLDHPTDGSSAPPTVAATRSMPTPQGSAAVLPPTRALPTVDPDGYRTPTPARARFRLGVAAVAVAAVVIAVVVALLTARSSGWQADPPATPTATTGAATPGPASTGTATTGATTRPTTTGGPAELVTAVGTSIREQARAGQLDPDAADDLAKKLDQISKDLAKGENDKAAENTAELQDKLTELVKDDKLTTAGLQALTPRLNQLAAALPAVENGN